MFRPTDPQISLLECRFLLPEAKVARLKKSWAEIFRQRILPLINEEVFRDAFDEDNGRPNKSIRLLVALHLLKEWDDLTDQQVLDQLEFNLQWHYALALEPDTAHLCQKTLHNFRVKLMLSERAQQMFEAITRGLVEMDGLHVGRQRLDSTHVISNIAVLTRLGLFVETVTNFLKDLRRSCPDKLANLDTGYVKRYLEREGYFADAKRKQAPRRLSAAVADVYRLVRAFADDNVVCELESYRLLVRLFEEQCEVVEDDEAEASPVLQAHLSADDDEPADQAEADAGERDRGPGAPQAEPESAQSTDDDLSQDSEAQLSADDGEPADQAEADAGERDRGPGAPQAESESAQSTDDDLSHDRHNDAPRAPEASAANAEQPDCLPPVGPEQSPEQEPRDAEGEANRQAPESKQATLSEEMTTPLRLKEGREVSSDSLQSPHDPDATYGHKGKGYEVQVAETCEDDNPYQVITAIAVNGAHESDQNATVPVAKQLLDSGLKPEELQADTGYGSGQNIIDCAKMGINLLCPVQDPGAPDAPDAWDRPVESATRDQRPEQPPATPACAPNTDVNSAIDLDAFAFNDTFDEIIACAAGWAPCEQHLDTTGRTVWAKFSDAHCENCPMAPRCPTRLLKTGDRRLRCRTASAATSHRQRLQRTDQFKERYKKRSGIESTNAELKSRHGADDLRVRGQEPVTLSMRLKAMALNVKRAVQYHVTRIRESAQAELATHAQVMT